jgi:P-type Ca2+ transporter type 2C
VVVATGMSTELGRISRLVQTVESGRTPLQENLDRLGSILGKAALAIVAIIVVLGVWRGIPPLEMFIFGIALAVAVLPEALRVRGPGARPPAAPLPQAGLTGRALPM